MRRKFNERPVNPRRSGNMRLYRDERGIRVQLYIYINGSIPAALQ
jgi:hypothetical protein